MRQHETEREQEIACSMRSGAERLRGRLYRDAGGHSAEAGGSSGVVEGQTNLTILRASEAVMSAAAFSITACLAFFSCPLDNPRTVFLFFFPFLKPTGTMGGHWNDGQGTQNQGNHIGDRSCVRQSKLYRR